MIPLRAQLIIAFLLCILCLFPRQSYYAQAFRYNTGIHKYLSQLINIPVRFPQYKSLSNLYANTPRYGKESYDKEKKGLVLDDIDQIMEAVELHKQIYGDLDITEKFEVPATDPWPFHLQGLRLGRRLKKLLSSQEFFDKCPTYVQQLREIGFEPDEDSILDEWMVVYESLKTFKAINGHCRIPAKFIVPDEKPWPRLARNMKLGVKVAAIRSAGRFIKDHKSRKADLDALGFEWKLRDHTHKQQLEVELFEQVYTALVHYKNNVNEDMLVPEDFEVPNGEGWPEETWGMNLGSLTKSIRKKDKLVFGHPDRMQRLAQLGFVLDESKRDIKSTKSFESTYQGLLIYRDLFGNVNVPQTYIIPAEAPWPEELWGYKLGNRVNNIRILGVSSVDRRQKLDAIGFNWETYTVKRKAKETDYADNTDDFDLMMAADIKAGDGVKKEDSSNEDTEVVDDEMDDTLLPNRVSTFPSRFDEEESIPVEFDPSRMFEPVSYRETSSEALREYMFSRDYSDDPDVRQIAHFEGYLTPEEFHDVTTRYIPEEDIKAMKQIGYRMIEFGRFNWDMFLEALRVYHKNYGDVDVPIDYVITEEIIQSDMGYPEFFEELPLGEFVQSVRQGDIDGLEDPERKQVLDGLGFVWGEPEKYLRFRFYPMMLGLRVYRHLYEFPLPDHDFNVPDEKQWPYWMCGMPLGEWAAACRVQQKAIAKYYPERKAILDAMEFLWWIPPGPIPERYYEPLPL